MFKANDIQALIVLYQKATTVRDMKKAEELVHRYIKDCEDVIRVSSGPIKNRLNQTKSNLLWMANSLTYFLYDVDDPKRQELLREQDWRNKPIEYCRRVLVILAQA